MMEMPESFGDSERSSRRRHTKRELFLEQMDKLVPWALLVDLAKPRYPDGRRGRPPYPLETILRVHFINCLMPPDRSHSQLPSCSRLHVPARRRCQVGERIDRLAMLSTRQGSRFR